MVVLLKMALQVLVISVVLQLKRMLEMCGFVEEMIIFIGTFKTQKVRRGTQVHPKGWKLIGGLWWWWKIQHSTRAFIGAVHPLSIVNMNF